MELWEEGVGAIVSPLSSSQPTPQKVLRGQSGSGIGCGWSLGALGGKFCFLSGGQRRYRKKEKESPLGERRWPRESWSPHSHPTPNFPGGGRRLGVGA